MSNNTLFKALSSNTRMKIIKALMDGEQHLSELARRIGISVPVTSRHVKILEKAGIVKRRVIGNVHILYVTTEILEDIFDPLVEEKYVEIRRNESILDALKQLPGFEIKKIGDKQYITSIDGEEGHYIYQVDGKVPSIPINQYKPKKEVVLELRKLVAIKKKRIRIKIPESND